MRARVQRRDVRPAHGGRAPGLAELGDPRLTARHHAGGRGGGVAFGPQPRSYSTQLPKALKRLAFRSALTVKGAQGQVKVVDDFDFEKPSTKSFQKVVEACGLKGQKVLFVTAENAPVLVKSSRNLPKVNATHLGSLGTWLRAFHAPTAI